METSETKTHPTEKHPFEPFLPKSAKVLFLGSFPPQEKRWSMKFYYPNYTNDFWYMIGLLWYEDKKYFTEEEKRFEINRVKTFCEKTGFAMYDTACEVRRLKDNASDKYLEIVKHTDIAELLRKIPECKAIVTTGQKATETLCEQYSCYKPEIGQSVKISIPIKTEGINTINKEYDFYRMPSTSRAYPIALTQKAETYRRMFEELGLL